MQRQAVPLLYPESPLVGTGLEAQAARDSGMVTVSHSDGKVTYVSTDKICITDFAGKEISYYLQKYQRSNQDTCINQRPSVWLGESVISGQVIADGAATEGGELALGQNILVAYLPWEDTTLKKLVKKLETFIEEKLLQKKHVKNYEKLILENVILKSHGRR